MQHRAVITRQALLETAAGLFDELGYAGTSISQICERADCTSGAIYFHFRGKAALAQAVVEGHFAAWPALIAEYATSDGPILDQVVALSYAVARAFREDPVVRGGARLWSEHRAIPLPLPAPFVGWISALTKLLTSAAAAGELATGTDPKAAARVVVAAFHGVHIVSDALTHRDDLDERLGEFWALALRALRAPTQ